MFSNSALDMKHGESGHIGCRPLADAVDGLSFSMQPLVSVNCVDVGEPALATRDTCDEAIFSARPDNTILPAGDLHARLCHCAVSGCDWLQLSSSVWEIWPPLQRAARRTRQQACSCDHARATKTRSSRRVVCKQCTPRGTCQGSPHSIARPRSHRSRAYWRERVCPCQIAGRRRSS
jgi:hypothetical protein